MQPPSPHQTEAAIPCSPLPLSLFDYDLPPELIAQSPARPRDASRLLVLPRREGPIVHRVFSELPSLLAAGDLLVVNRTQVIPARLHVERPNGGRAELLFTRPLDTQSIDDAGLTRARRWQALGRPGKALKPGTALRAPGGTELRVEERQGEMVVVSGAGPLWPILQQHGEVPLPPYITRPAAAVLPSDRDDYQTLFAREPGAVAAPTAALHFTPRTLNDLRARGVEIAELVLHVGAGTFLPVRREHENDVRGHVMHAEHYEIAPVTQAAIAEAKTRGGRVVAVGTTTVRAIETWAATGAASGESRLFIYPGMPGAAFQKVDALLTNFHLPRSTLLMLVSALAGQERVLDAYATAVAERYRFFSYGDAMLIL